MCQFDFLQFSQNKLLSSPLYTSLMVLIKTRLAVAKQYFFYYLILLKQNIEFQLIFYGAQKKEIYCSKQYCVQCLTISAQLT